MKQLIIFIIWLVVNLSWTIYNRCEDLRQNDLHNNLQGKINVNYSIKDSLSKLQTFAARLEEDEMFNQSRKRSLDMMEEMANRRYAIYLQINKEIGNESMYRFSGEDLRNYPFKIYYEINLKKIK